MNVHVHSAYYLQVKIETLIIRSHIDVVKLQMKELNHGCGR